MEKIYQIKFSIFKKYCKYMDPAPRAPYSDKCKKKSAWGAGWHSSYDCERKTCPVFKKLKEIK